MICFARRSGILSSSPYHTTILIFFSLVAIASRRPSFLFLSQILFSLKALRAISKSSCPSLCGNNTVTTW